MRWRGGEEMRKRGKREREGRVSGAFPYTITHLVLWKQ